MVMRTANLILRLAALLIIVGSASLSCRRAAAPMPGGTTGGGANDKSRGLPRAELIFPADVRCDDDAVNRFVEDALSKAAGHDYEAFRGTWMTMDEPYAREQFERGWKSLRAIRVGLVQKIRDPSDQSIGYAVYAVAELDPSELPPDQPSRRRVVLEVRKELDQWRLAHPRDAVRAAILARYKELHPQEAGDAPSP